MVIPTTFTSCKAFLTASKRCGLMMASTFFILVSSSFLLCSLMRCPRRAAGRRKLFRKRRLGLSHQRLRELPPVGVGDVENVERVRFLGGDLRADDVESEGDKGARDLVGEARLVRRVNLDHGRRGRGVVVA